MTIAQKKQSFIEVYRDTYGNLSESLKITEIKPSEYNKFMELPDFKREVEAVQQLRSDLIDSRFLALVNSGDVRAVIEAKKMEAERKNGIDIDEIRTKVMIYLITHAKTKTEVLTAYCDWFKVAESTADSYFKKIIIEHALKDQTPINRAKAERLEKDSMLAERFKKGDLTEIEMLTGSMEIHLHTLQTAEFPSERAGASKEVREIGKRLEEIQERERVKNTFSNEEWVDIIDSIVLDSDIDKVKELKQKMILLEAK